MNPELSIIIPVYNVELYLRECLESVRNQTYDNFECILVDDGSKDASGEICNEYAEIDKRFKVFHIENAGVSNARNYGIKHSIGEYITFIDSDDCIDKDTYAKVIKIFENDNCEVCCYGIKRVSNGHITQVVEFKDKGILKNFINYDVYMHSACNKVFKRSLIVDHDISFPIDLIVCEDMLFTFKALSLSKKVSYLDKNYYTYRINEQSVCQSGYSDKKIQNYREVSEKLEHFCNLNGLSIKYRKFIDYRKMYYAIQYLINPDCYSPVKFRDYNRRFKLWIYTFRPDLFFMTFFSSIYFDLPARLFIELKKKMKG